MLSSPTHTRSKPHAGENSFIRIRLLLVLGVLCFSALGLLAAPVPTGKPGTYPAWWFSREVIQRTNTNVTSPAWPANYPTSDDYVAINQGQLKNFATQAYNELQAQTPSYVWSTSQGTALSSLITGWNPANGDAYAAVNLGQLKTVAKPFYDVLIQMGYTTSYPWTGTGADDYAAANIGQVKNLFSFDVGLDSDGNGLPDWWEMKYFGYMGNNPTWNLDGNGFTLLQDYQSGADPTNYYSQPNPNGPGAILITPTITITGGNNQTGPSATFLAQPLVVKVTDASNHPLVGAPVTFAITGTAGGGVALSTAGSVAGSLFATTDSTGAAQVYYAGALADGAASSIQVTAGISSASFGESTEPIDNSVAATTNVASSPGPGNGEVNVTWVNHASNATFFIILKSIDGVYWTTVATVNDPAATSYTATGLNPSQSYYFAVIAGNPN